MPNLQELPPLPPGPLPPLLTVSEAAAALRVDASTVYRAVRQGRLRAVRLGGPGTSVRIPAAALQELLAGTATEPKEAA